MIYREHVYPTITAIVTSTPIVQRARGAKGGFRLVPHQDLEQTRTYSVRLVGLEKHGPLSPDTQVSRTRALVEITIAYEADRTEDGTPDHDYQAIRPRIFDDAQWQQSTTGIELVRGSDGTDAIGRSLQRDEVTGAIRQVITVLVEYRSV